MYAASEYSFDNDINAALNNKYILLKNDAFIKNIPPQVSIRPSLFIVSIIQFNLLVLNCSGINSFVNSSRLIQLIASIIGAVIMALFTFISGIAQIGVLQIILYQIIWTVILSVPAITRKKY